MKKWIAAGALAGIAALSAPSFAQAPAPMPVPAETGAGGYVNPADAGAVTYRTTGWDPSLIAYAAGGLGLAGLALKGFLRREAAE